MSLSKPFMDFLSFYFQNLYINPVRTKSITSCLIGSAGNVASQLAAGGSVKLEPVVAFGLYGLLFGGSIPHYLYQGLDTLFPNKTVAFAVAKKLLFERLLIAPLVQAFSLYTISRFEGKAHNVALKQLFMLYSVVLKANWKWLTLFQIINFTYVPPMLRVLFMNLVGFGWAMYLATKRRQNNKPKTKAN